MALVRMFDASTPPGRPFPGCAAVAGYIGGNTPHVWTAAEWNAASDNGRLYQLPIWVGFDEADPAAHATQAAIAAAKLGWQAHHRPAWRAIVADVENVREKAWLRAFGDQLQMLGFLCFPYMSQVAVPSDPPGYTLWLALWDLSADIPPIHNVALHQYTHDVPFAGTAVDLSAVERSVLDTFGRGPRRG